MNIDMRINKYEYTIKIRLLFLLNIRLIFSIAIAHYIY